MHLLWLSELKEGLRGGMKLTLNVVVSAGSKFCHQGPGVEHHLAHRLAHRGEPDASHRLHSYHQASGKFYSVPEP
jgi:hypothetical protein